MLFIVAGLLMMASITLQEMLPKHSDVICKCLQRIASTFPRYSHSLRYLHLSADCRLLLLLLLLLLSLLLFLLLFFLLHFHPTFTCLSLVCHLLLTSLSTIN